MNNVALVSVVAGFIAISFVIATIVTGLFRRHYRLHPAGTKVQAHPLAAFIALVLRSLIVLAIAGAAKLALQHSSTPAIWSEQLSGYLHAWILVWLAAFGFALLESLILLIYRVMKRPVPLPELLRNILRAVLVVSVFFAVLKYNLGINIGTLLASTALITAVVGFALQGVLSNLMSGMSMHLVRSVVPGDWVSVDDTTEGEVIETNWRETRLRTIAGHIMIIPNSRMAGAIVHNMTQPTPRRRHSIMVRAGYADAPGEVITALLESVKDVSSILADPPPSAIVSAYRDFGIEYRLRFWSDRYYERFVLDSDVQRRIWYQFKRRGITIPFPMNDQLLNDFMAMAFHDRPDPTRRPGEGAAIARDLLNSDLFARLLIDESKKPLLAPNEIEGVAASARRVLFTAGEAVFAQGGEGTSCYVVVRGKLCGRVDHAGIEKDTEFELGPGALFGEMSIMTGSPRAATISCHTEVELIEISEETFRRILSARPDIPERLSRLVAARIAENEASFRKLKNLEDADGARQINRDNILQRFLRLLGRA